MRNIILVLLLAFAPLPALAQAVQNYDLIASAPYPEPDGTTQPAGTCVGRAAWNGVTPYAPDGVTLKLDPQQTTACYFPTFASAPVAPVSVAVVSASTPAISGTYSISAASVSNITAIIAGIAAGQGFPGGGSTLTYVDAGGVAHVFETTPEFVAFAAAIRNYVYALQLNGLGDPTPLPPVPLQVP